MKALNLFICMLLVLVASLAGCAPGATPAPAPAKAVVVQSAEVRFLDPTLRPTTADANVDLNLYDGLVLFDKDLKTVPGLATSWQSINPTTWEFKLRTGVKFHNGEPFNADTVVAWFERLVTVEARIKEQQSSYTQITSVDKVQKVDDFTVRFITKVPDPVLPTRLASYYCLITPAKYIADNGDKALFEKPIGTGPYKFVEWVKDDHLTIVANEEYWGGAPKVKTIVFRPVTEPSSRIAALKAGEAQIADAIAPGDVASIKTDAKLDVRSVPEATRNYYWNINTTKGPPLGELKVRQALNYAVDKQSLIDKLLMGQAKQNASVVPMQAFGWCDPGLWEYNPAKAKQLLAEAGYPNGFDLKVNYSPGHYIAEDEIVQATGSMLAAVGIKVQYVPWEWATRLTQVREMKMEGIWYSGKTNLALDADYGLAELLADKQFGWHYPLTGKSLELYNQERQEMDPVKRAALACEIQKQYRDGAGMIMLWQQDVIFGAAKKLNWQPRADGFIRAVDMSWAP